MLYSTNEDESTVVGIVPCRIRDHGGESINVHPLLNIAMYAKRDRLVTKYSECSPITGEPRGRRIYEEKERKKRPIELVKKNRH